MKRKPKFKSEAEERKFWASHDSAGLVDWRQVKKVSSPNLKKSGRLRGA